MTRLSVTVTRALTTDDKPLLPRETFMVGPGGFQSVDAGCLAFGVQTPEPAQETDRRRTNRNDDGVIESVGFRCKTSWEKAQHIYSSGLALCL